MFKKPLGGHPNPFHTGRVKKRMYNWGSGENMQATHSHEFSSKHMDELTCTNIRMHKRMDEFTHTNIHMHKRERTCSHAHSFTLTLMHVSCAHAYISTCTINYSRLDLTMSLLLH